MEDFKKSPLWKNAFKATTEYPKQCQILESAFDSFRSRVSLLVAQIHKDMPSLTVHDITHLDALWWTASEITGDDYPLNPAEAFVLGGAILLHDSAHSIAAYPGGIEEITNLPEWKSISSRYQDGDSKLDHHSKEFQLALFDTLRAMHPKQARKLPLIHWSPPGDSAPMYLIENDELRSCYGDIIGQIAESHWFHPHELENFKHLKATPPALLHPTPWTVDVLKLAAILRTADAAHIDSQRAPKFLSAITQPGGASLVHWQFQARVNKVKRDPDPDRNELCITSSPFPASEQEAWWLAYDMAQLINKELQAVDRLLLDTGRKRFMARTVAYAYNSDVFAKNVPTENWHPVDSSVKISDVNSIVEHFGGEQLYGNFPSLALRELIQNSTDAIHACRSLGGLGDEEGEIEVSLKETSDNDGVLQITDTGIGMSRYVLTDVLLDFGRSLWRSPEINSEWSDLSGTKFQATGKFGIGFFSIFMLGSEISLTTKRYESKDNESSDWILEFKNGTHTRPILRKPAPQEKLKRHGTRISIKINSKTKEKLLTNRYDRNPPLTLAQLCASLAPALDINLYTQVDDNPKEITIRPNDWTYISPQELRARLAPLYRAGEQPFEHLSTISDSAGSVKGRLAVDNERYLSAFTTATGVGTCNGIFAGRFDGVYGIVKSKPQADLARQTASPDLTLEEIRKWAHEQKDILLFKKGISPLGGMLLLAMGATEDNLPIAEINQKPATLEDIRKLAQKKTTKQIIIHSGEVDHESEDDVLRYEFTQFFKPTSNLISIVADGTPEWLLERDDYSQEELIDLIITNIIKIWPNADYTDEEISVGKVGNIEIYRNCVVIDKN